LWRYSLGRDRCGYRPAFVPSKISNYSSAAIMGFIQRFLRIMTPEPIFFILPDGVLPYLPVP
jgi:hypothetical protein